MRSVKTQQCSSLCLKWPERGSQCCCWPGSGRPGGPGCGKPLPSPCGCYSAAATGESGRACAWKPLWAVLGCHYLWDLAWLLSVSKEKGYVMDQKRGRNVSCFRPCKRGTSSTVGGTSVRFLLAQVTVSWIWSQTHCSGHLAGVAAGTLRERLSSRTQRVSGRGWECIWEEQGQHSLQSHHSLVIQLCCKICTVFSETPLSLIHVINDYFLTTVIGHGSGHNGNTAAILFITVVTYYAKFTGQHVPTIICLMSVSVICDVCESVLLKNWLHPAISHNSSEIWG